MHLLSWMRIQPNCLLSILHLLCFTLIFIFFSFSYFEFFQLLCTDCAAGNFMDAVDIPAFTMFLFLQMCAHRCSTSRDIPGDSWPFAQNMRQYLQDLYQTQQHHKSLHSYISSHIKVCTSNQTLKLNYSFLLHFLGSTLHSRYNLWSPYHQFCPLHEWRERKGRQR